MEQCCVTRVSENRKSPRIKGAYTRILREQDKKRKKMGDNLLVET